jgi:hypothetical protein
MLVQERFRIDGSFYSRELIVCIVPKNNCHVTCLFYEYIGELFLTLFWFLVFIFCSLSLPILSSSYLHYFQEPSLLTRDAFVYFYCIITPNAFTRYLQ